MHRLVIIVVLLCNLVSFGQQNTLLMHSFYKDRMYESSYIPSYKGNSFYPVLESEHDLNQNLKDSTKQYYDATDILFKKHLLEFKGEDYYLTVSPALDFTYSRDLDDTSGRKLFQNTRGVFIEGDLFDNFSFSTSFFENQSRNSRYESLYYAQHGELYPKTNGYSTQNAVIPGAGRTKAFKTNGFDYAYAIGNIIYKATNWLTIIGGNNQQFIGDGYRSLLLSDNSYSAPYYRLMFRLNRKWSFNYLRSKQLNLIRKPISTTVESYYDPKSYAVNYLSYQATPTIALSLFEGSQYSRSDSLESKRANPLFYNPIPFIGGLALSDQEVFSIYGLNIGWTLKESTRIYSQLTTNNAFNSVGIQLGVRLSEPFKVNNLFLQIEGNYAGNSLYKSSNPRLNYAHYNLPLAHPKGEGFTEIIVRGNYEWQRIYIDLKAIYYALNEYSSIDLLPIHKNSIQATYNVFHGTTELGYRFNKKYNLNLFGSIIYRSTTNEFGLNATIVSVGLRTGLLNHYTDF